MLNSFYKQLKSTRVTFYQHKVKELSNGMSFLKSKSTYILFNSTDVFFENNVLHGLTDLIASEKEKSFFFLLLEMLLNLSSSYLRLDVTF